MKAILVLFLAGLLAVQATHYAPVASSFRIPAKTIQIADDELWGLFDLTDAVNYAGHFVGSVANQAYVNTRNAVLQNYHTLEDNVHNTIAATVAFNDAIAAWQQVDYRTGKGIIRAIQVTAKDCQGLYVALNKLSGGRLNSAALNYAEGVAIEVFPPSAVIIESGKIVYRAYGQARDITELIHNIDNDVKTHNWGALAVDAFKLFKIIYNDL